MELTHALHWPRLKERLAALATASGFTPSVLAETPAGPLTAWEKAGTGPTVYISSGIHGDEPAGPLAVVRLLESGLFNSQINWRICPVLNPTGLAAGVRDNHLGLDLNRDYYLRVSSEVSAHARWIESSAAPDIFLSLHEDWEVKDFYLYEINTGTDEPHIARGILEAVSEHFNPESSALIDDHTPREPGWIYHPPEPDEPHGWPEAIFLAKKGCPLSFTFETPSSAALSDRVAAHCAAVNSALLLKGYIEAVK
jgi:protein MpaA